MSRLQKVIISVLLVVAAGVFIFWPMVQHPDHMLVGVQRDGNNDLTGVYYAMRVFPTVAEGENLFRHWNPYSQFGTPYLGNPQSASLYPPNWLFWLFPTPAAASWLLIAHHLWAGLGATLLCRRYGCGDFPALLAGLIFMGAPFLIAQSGEGHTNQVCIASWIPWAFLAYEHWRAAKPAGTLMLVLTLALAFLAGHVQEAYYLVLILTCWMVIDALGEFRTTKSFRTFIGLGARWCLVGLGTAGVVAIELFPNIIYSMSSVRSGGIGTGDIIGDVTITSLWQLAHPFLLGELEEVPLFWERLVYFGVAPLLLAVAGFSGSFGKARHELTAAERNMPLRFGGLWAITFAFAFGPGSPVFFLLYNFVPGVNLFRAPGRALYFTLFFATAILAGYGAHYLGNGFNTQGTNKLTDHRNRNSSVSKAVALAVVFCCGTQVVVTAVASELSTDGSVDNPLEVMRIGWNNLTPIPWLIGGIAAALLLAGLKLRPRYRPMVLATMVVLVVVELSWFSQAILRTVPAPVHRQQHPIVQQIRARNKAGAAPPRLIANQYLISDREAWENRLAKVQAYEPAPLTANVTIVDALFESEPLTSLLGFGMLNLSALNPETANAFGIRFAVVSPQEEVPENWQRLARGNIEPEFHISGGSESMPRLAYELYENLDVLPRAYVVGNARQIDPSQRLVEQIRTVELRKEVLVSNDVFAGKNVARSNFAPAKIVDFAADHLKVVAEADGVGYLVLSENLYPGWTATVDGKTTPITRANIGCRAIPLGPGKHVVEFRYRAAGFDFGLRVTGISMLGLLLGTWGGWRYRRRMAS